MPRTKRSGDHQAFLDELADLWPLAKGSLTEVRKPCIRPACPACREGRKHKAIFFSFSKGGQRVCRYVPAELAPVKHADETSWRNDGANGYAWLFCTPDLSVFRLRPTRAADRPPP